MTKRVNLLLATVAAIALAAPATSSAAPAVTDGKGNLVEVATIFTAKSTDLVVATSIGSITCKVAEAEWELTKNTGNLVTGRGLNEHKLAECTLAKKTVPVKEFVWFKLESAVAGQGTLGITIEVELPWLGEGFRCHFDSVGAPFTYNAGGEELVFKAADLEGSQPLCEPGLLSAGFILKGPGGGKVVLD